MAGMAAVIDSTQVRRRSLQDVDFTFGPAAKAENESGWLEGYASVFNVIDQQAEVVRPGAFTKTIAERVSAGKVKLMTMHMAFGGDTMEVIGTIASAKEDTRGLWIHADFASTDHAQEARKLAVEGHVSGLSIGYNAMAAAPLTEDGKTIIELTELRLLEVTLTARPVNELALVTDAKGLSPFDNYVEAREAFIKLEVLPIANSLALGKGRELSADERGRLTACRDACKALGGKLDVLLTPPDTGAQDTAASAAEHADLEARRKWLKLQA